MQPVTPSLAYDRTTVVLHWLTAALVVTQWVGAQVIDLFPSDALRVDARSIHIVLGAFLAALLAFRIWWRTTRGRRLPPADRGALNVLAKVTHRGLYVLLVSMVIVGLSLAWARGDSLFGIVRITTFPAGHRVLADRLQEIHAALGWAILALAGAHAAAALTHRYVMRDHVLARMRPTVRR